MAYELKTEIMIGAGPDKIWEHLSDFPSYPSWNPFVTSVEGQISEGASFKVTLQPPGGKPMVFKPRCLAYKPGKEFRWLGHLLIPGLFDGEHIFELQEKENGQTQFIQREKFKGILVPLFKKMLETQTRAGFEKMNQALKERAEK